MHCETVEETLRLYDILRCKTYNQAHKVELLPDCKQEQYLSIFTSKLVKQFPYNNISNKELEEALLQKYRKINSNLIQVMVEPSKLNGLYTGKLVFRSGEDGKSFLLDYERSKKDLASFYKCDVKDIKFDLFLQKKDLRSYRDMESTIIKRIETQKTQKKVH